MIFVHGSGYPLTGITVHDKEKSIAFVNILH
jgi:hypothetical protein